jgi:hypothetical protein
MYHGRDWDYEIQSKVFDEMTRDLNRPTATSAPKKTDPPAGAKLAVAFLTVALFWVMAIAVLMPCVWLLWTAAKWMFSF